MTAIMTRSDVVQRIEQAGIVAVVRLTDAGVGREVANALIDGGVTAIEITMTVPRAVDLIAELSRALPQALIGAGTVTDPETARLVIAAGAKFVVSPVFRPRIVEACHERDVAVIGYVFLREWTSLPGLFYVIRHLPRLLRKRKLIQSRRRADPVDWFS